VPPDRWMAVQGLRVSEQVLGVEVTRGERRQRTHGRAARVSCTWGRHEAPALLRVASFGSVDMAAICGEGHPLAEVRSPGTYFIWYTRQHSVALGCGIL